MNYICDCCPGSGSFVEYIAPAPIVIVKLSAGELVPDHAKGSDTHKNSVTNDTVGDHLKDTSGPLNIVMKLTAILNLVFGSAIADASNFQGGPFWMKCKVTFVFLSPDHVWPAGGRLLPFEQW